MSHLNGVGERIHGFSRWLGRNAAFHDYGKKYGVPKVSFLCDFD